MEIACDSDVNRCKVSLNRDDSFQTPNVCTRAAPLCRSALTYTREKSGCSEPTRSCSQTESIVMEIMESPSDAGRAGYQVGRISWLKCFVQEQFAVAWAISTERSDLDGLILVALADSTSILPICFTHRLPFTLFRGCLPSFGPSRYDGYLRLWTRGSQWVVPIRYSTRAISR